MALDSAVKLLVATIEMSTPILLVLSLIILEEFSVRAFRKRASGMNLLENSNLKWFISIINIFHAPASLAKVSSIIPAGPDP